MGHIHRALPYTFNSDNDDEVKLRNNIRVAEVYMDDYIAYFRAVVPRKQFELIPNIKTENKIFSSTFKT